MLCMDLIDVLLDATTDPVTYSIIFFTYVILTVIILPIPVEIGLFNPHINPLWLVFLMAVGKGAGAFVVFEIGTRARTKIKELSTGTPLTRKIVAALERFVIKYGNYGLFIIMSTPLMLDSVTLYLFSLLNPERQGTRALERRKFVLINTLAGVVRASIILLLWHIAGTKLV
jgi:membrane protein DedA with SNARE-associated domain